MTKSHGFSITEVLISVLVVAIVAAIVLPMKIIDINQAERIAKWKASYVEIMYSFKL
ncbi:type II secretion system protein, partial [bacterium]|nr:type II secretion system protein [bacterium]